MRLAKFNIIVAIDKNGGIAKNGEIPWHSNADMKFFRDITIGQGNNAVIMGRKTYESIPQEFRPLKQRHNVVISSTWKQVDHTDISVYPTFLAALEGVGASAENYGEVYVVGGESIYELAIQDYLYLCNKIYVTVFRENYECNQFFPWPKVRNFKQINDKSQTQEYTRFTFAPEIYHEEYNYLSLLEKVRENGDMKTDRTDTGTISLFGPQIEFDISERLPIITTKKMFPEKALRELLFFISGKCDSKVLEAQDVPFWKDNSSKDFIVKRGLDYREGDIGPLYPHQWRHWGAEYRGCEADYEGEGIDQLSDLITGIRTDPQSRRHILSAWNVSDLDAMVLPPCHSFVQFYVSGDNKHLDCKLTMRSADLFLGVPYNIACYSILTYMIGHLTNLKPRRLVMSFGDAHIYKNHMEQVNKQLARMPKPFPTLKFVDSSSIRNIDDFKFENFKFENYSSWSVLNAKMAK